MNMINEAQKELLERVVWQLNSDIELIEYHLEHINMMFDETFLDSFSGRLSRMVKSLSSKHTAV